MGIISGGRPGRVREQAAVRRRTRAAAAIDELRDAVVARVQAGGPRRSRPSTRGGSRPRSRDETVYVHSLVGARRPDAERLAHHQGS